MEFTFSDYLFSDLHKDAYGCRPTSSDCNRWMDSSDEEKQEWWDSMIETMQWEQKMVQEHQAKQIAALESRIEMNITLGAGDRKTALRWVLDSFNPDELEFYGAERVAYELGLPYNHPVVAEMDSILEAA